MGDSSTRALEARLALAIDAMKEVDETHRCEQGGCGERATHQAPYTGDWYCIAHVGVDYIEVAWLKSFRATLDVLVGES